MEFSLDIRLKEVKYLELFFFELQEGKLRIVHLGGFEMQMRGKVITALGEIKAPEDHWI